MPMSRHNTGHYLVLTKALQVNQLYVPAALLYQVRVCPNLYDLALVEDEDQVGPLDAAEAVRDGNSGPPSSGLIGSGLHHGF